LKSLLAEKYHKYERWLVSVAEACAEPFPKAEIKQGRIDFLPKKDFAYLLQHRMSYWIQ
jgi:hypothetical protein